jgi:hypothetical protein
MGDLIMKIEGVLDHYFPDPGTCDAVDCGICGTPMFLTKDHYGPTSWTMAMGGSKRKYDSFECSYYKEFWHKQVKKLLQEAKTTPSPSLKEIYKKDAEAILFTRKHTKEVYD